MAKPKAKQTASGADLVVKQDDKIETVKPARKLKRNEAGVWGKPHTTAPQPTGERLTTRKNGRWSGDTPYTPPSAPRGQKRAERVETEDGARWVTPPPPPEPDED